MNEGYSHDLGVMFHNNKYMVSSISDKKTFLLVKRKETDIREAKQKNEHKKNNIIKQVVMKILLGLDINLSVKLDTLVSHSISLFSFLFVYMLFYLYISKFKFMPLIYALINIIIFIQIIVKMYSVLKYNERQRFRNHGAEHKVLNAYRHIARKKRSNEEVLNYISTLDNVKKMSRYSSKCGSNKMTNFFFAANICLISSILLNYSLPILIIWGIIDLSRLNPYAYFMQKKFFTDEPIDNELKLSIVTFKKLLEISSMNDEEVEEIYFIDDCTDKEKKYILENIDYYKKVAF